MTSELVDVVDLDDRVVTTVSRAEMRQRVLRHRAVFVVVHDGVGNVLVHKRSPDKDVWPGWMDLAVGGVLRSGETYETGARREVFEEIGIDAIDLEVFDAGRPRPYDDDQVSLLGRCFVLCHGGPFVFRDGEISEAWWTPIAEIDDVVRRHRFLPDSSALLLDRLTSLLD